MKRKLETMTKLLDSMSIDELLNELDGSGLIITDLELKEKNDYPGFKICL